MGSYSRGLSIKPYYPTFGEIAQRPIFQNRPPTTTDRAEDGRAWFDQENDAVYALIKTRSNVSTWICLGGGAGVFTTVTASGNITSGGNISATGQLFAGANVASTTTVVAGTSITATLGDITATDGDIVATTGDFVAVAEGKGFECGSGAMVIDYNGDPNGVVTAAQGTLCLNIAGSGVADRLWVNTNAGTNWTHLVSGA